MSKHTQEPWNDKLVKVCFVELGKLGVHVTVPHYPDEEAKENARRIVACVNACAGMEDPSEDIAKLKHQCDELLEAMEFVTLQAEKAMQKTYGKDKDWEIGWALFMARDSITKAKGGAE